MIDVEFRLISALDNLSESLKHPKHESKLNPLRELAAKVLARFFRRQQRLLLKQIRTHLKHVVTRKVTEASKESKDAISFALPDGSLLPFALTDGMTVDYGRVLSAALEAGYDTLAADLAMDKTISPDVTAEYLRQNSLTKLTGNFASTTVDRLRNALADAYEAGAGYEGLVQAVKDEYVGFSSVRAGMIAQTEMNAAYNVGRKSLANDLDFNEKWWSCDGPNPCEQCLANQAQGWIPIDEDFESGDDLAPSHPGCYCSNDFRIAA